MKRMVLAAVVLVGLALVALPRCGAAAEDKLDLRFRLVKGESYKLLTTIDQTFVQKIDGDEQSVVQKMSLGCTYHVKEVDDAGTATIETSFDSLSFRQDGPAGKIEYDSENPPDELNPMLKGFAFFVGQKFSIKTAPNGTVTDIEGVDEIFDKMTEALDVPDGPMKNSIIANMKAQFGEEAMKEMVEKRTAIFPEEPVSVGDSWSKKRAFTMGVPMTIDATYTLKSRKDGIATIAVKAKVEPNADAPPMEMGSVTVQYRLSGTMEGTCQIVETTGWFHTGLAKGKLSGTTTMTGIPGLETDQTWQISVENTTRFESK